MWASLSENSARSGSHLSVITYKSGISFSAPPPYRFHYIFLQPVVPNYRYCAGIYTCWYTYLPTDHTGIYWPWNLSSILHGYGKAARALPHQALKPDCQQQWPLQQTTNPAASKERKYNQQKANKSQWESSEKNINKLIHEPTYFPSRASLHEENPLKNEAVREQAPKIPVDCGDIVPILRHWQSFYPCDERASVRIYVLWYCRVLRCPIGLESTPVKLRSSCQIVEIQTHASGMYHDDCMNELIITGQITHAWVRDAVAA